MKTPLFDFLSKFSSTRFHMPGHKGNGPLGCEKWDLTEVTGADVLYRETGILKESQENASLLFGTAKTLYSTEGSTLCIRAMLALIKRYASEIDAEPVIAAGRNAHKAFLTGCALLDLDPLWISGAEQNGLAGLSLGPEEISLFLKQCDKKPLALYLTSPDYLGNLLPIREIAEICHREGILLLVDQAHGAYLRFLPESLHAISQNADLVCDSAHKTLPVLTGGAYLHVGATAPEFFPRSASDAMSLFASTSPSYLILASLDLVNGSINERYRAKLLSLCEKVFLCKQSLQREGFRLVGNDPLRICLATKFVGWTGNGVADVLREAGMECEFSDPDYVVFMISTETAPEELERLVSLLLALPKKEPILKFPPRICLEIKRMTPKQALFSPREEVPVSEAVGRILATPSESCPPAVPIAVCGEEISESARERFDYYGIKTVFVVKHT